jgi:Ca-activated chloride channel family protein
MHPRRPLAVSLSCTVLLLCGASLLSTVLPARPAQAQRSRRLPASVLQRRLPPPALLVRRNRRTEQMQLTRLSVDARVVGHLAETTITMTFANPNNAVLEGDLVFPLPEGSTVSGYALDIGGQLVDGVVVDKHEARQAFETEVRRGVDPGLVEWTKGNSFKTRVFPIPAKGSRTIRLSYVSEIHEGGAQTGAYYYLPLAFKKKVAQLSMRVEVVKAASKPQVLQGGPARLGFGRWRDSFVASAKLANATLDKDLYVALPGVERSPLKVERANGATYFALRDRVTMAPRPRSSAPGRIGLYWDASLSRAKADHKKELALLDAYLERLGNAPVSLYLVLLRDRAATPRLFKLPAQRKALISTLRDLRYDGATQLGAAVPRGAMKRVDLNLLFSDGISTFGDEDPLGLKAPVYAINVSTSASHAFLRYLALRTGGAYFNLQRTAPRKVAAAIGRPVFSFISAEVTSAPNARGKAKQLYPRLRTATHGSFDLAGKLEGAAAVVTLRYGYGTRVTTTRRYTVKAKDATQGTLLARYWAQKKVADLLVFPDRNAEAIAAVGKRHGIVTPRTSLIVLERLSQYLEHGIRPPKMLTKMRASWDTEMARRAKQQKSQQASKLAHVLALWKARLRWYDKRFRYPKNYRHRQSPKAKGGGRRRMRRPAARPRRRSAELSDAFSADSPAPMAAKKSPRKPKPALRPQPTIAMKPWNPKTPYLAALAATPARQRYTRYLQERDKHGKAPAFYLDCAHFFRQQKRPRLALRVLSNLAELELENPALLRVLAYQLTQIGELDHAVRIFETVRKLRPEEPQSYRDLALVLERRADRARKGRNRGAKQAAVEDYRRALSLLSTVVMRKWQRFAEIEVIALTELNTILPKARAVGLRQLPVDRRLIRRLPMDVRIVMSWDADNTDMDLHVVEPSGEEAYYSHNRTRIGGLVTRDFTRGYGPEVYALRRAMRGAYRIRTKFYGSSAAKLTGAVTLQVDVYTNYGRRNQRRRSMTLRLTKRKETFTVAKIRF